MIFDSFPAAAMWVAVEMIVGMAERDYRNEAPKIQTAP